MGYYGKPAGTSLHSPFKAGRISEAQSRTSSENIMRNICLNINNDL